MCNFLERLAQIAEQTPNKTALKVSLHNDGVSYANLALLSGRILCYLNKKSIGKEDFVAIYLPRGVEPFICVVGVLKAGAAFVLIEESSAPERAAYIQKDCGCKLTIDSAVWQEILHEQSSCEIAPWDEHAAAFAVYTSGSTGTPKGVVHEYGNLKTIIESIQTQAVAFLPEDRMAMIAPLTFVASTMVFLSLLFVSAALYIVPYVVVKNPKVFLEYLFENCISVVFLPPSVFRTFPKFGPHMRAVYLGGEISVRTYREDILAINVYAMSETGSAICCFLIDKLYDITPIGRSEFNFGLRLLDENDHPVPDGELGEICVYVPFVRGYLNRPDETKRAFGEGHLFRTGDLARKQTDGNYVIHGRKDDMIAINGNRIEPGEIEEVVKRVLNLDWATAKGFLDGDSGFICVYYTKDIEIDEEKTRQTLLQYLPYYMLPSHFIKLDSVPLNAHRKLDRQALLPPVREAGRRAYAAPTNKLEAQLCNAFAKALKLEHIGINDDFYQLGGDSLASMTALLFCDMEDLTIAEIFRGRTPAKIAKLYEELHANSYDTDTDIEAALKRSFLLTPEQLYMLDFQLCAPKSTMYNLPFFARLHESIDMKRFVDAVSKAIARHPALLTVFTFNEDNEIVQHYDATLAAPIVVEQTSESALAVLKDTLICPHTVVNSPLYRCRIFKTEKDLYVFFDVHHTVFDGTSFHVLLHDVDMIYNGKTELQEDCYYSMPAENARIMNSKAFKESKDYFKHRYEKHDFRMLDPYANKTEENRLGSVNLLLPKIQDIQLAAVPKHQPVGNNVFFLTITALALARHCKKTQVNFEWIYNGRSSAKRMSTVGLLFNTLPLSVQLPGNRKIAEVLEDIQDQVNLGIQHGCVHYLSSRFQGHKDYTITMLYQNELYALDTLGGYAIEQIPLKNLYAAAPCALDLEIYQAENGTQLMFHFNSGQFAQAFIEEYAHIYEMTAKKLLANADTGELTVNDLI